MLLASIHDVGPRFEREVTALVDRLERHLGGPRFAMLVVPDHWGEAPLSKAPAFQQRLRAWADAGVEMFLHGWSHRDDSAHGGAGARFKAKHMTAGEGEFLGLDRTEAVRRMRAGRAVMEDAIGRPVAGFIAPAWLYGDGARAALADEGFALAEDHFRVWRPADGAILARGPVITWASRSPRRIASSRLFAGLARAALHPLPVVRVAVHPGDAHVPSLLASIDATLGTFARRRIGHYGDLVAAASSPVKTVGVVAQEAK
ncbi:polysaccharide deacetylase family protein [Sphingomonas nostoxanthinifaciens]|nr:polysaccharide deacetylase family protein [Sphingomonas nostoxanthinifaciens]